ncbi:MAG TPA: sigma-70 family RNA polymerase sigma factor [Planctomycetota bacterium]
MSTADGNPLADELLRHARWIRGLAGALLRDEAAAEGLAQETWVAALSHPPSSARLRPWLREVARNFARRHHRGAARRGAREQAARPPAPLEAPDELAQRLEAEQRLSRELAALEEPFRTVLMLRFYEDLAPAEIAARLRLPGGTVRWRLMRALELLRERLDRAHGGDRRAWSLAFAPLARLDGAAGVTAAATAVVLPGVVLMNVLKLSVAAAGLLALALGLSLGGFLPESLSLARRERPLEVQFRPLEAVPVAVPASPVEAAPAPTSERVALAGERAPEQPLALAEELATIDARFLARGRGLSDARLVVLHDEARHEALSAGPDGLATCSLALDEPRALVRIELSALGYASEERTAVCTRGETTHLGQIELVPGGAVAGRVVDERGLGLPGCRVTLGSAEHGYPELEARRLHPAPAGIPSAETDAAGRFRLLGVAAGMTRLWAHAPGRIAGYSPPFEVRAGQESSGVEIALAPLAPENRLRGIVLDPTGAPVPFAEIAYRHATRGGNSVTSGQTRADREGRFEFLLAADARSWLRATDPAGRWNAGSLADVPNGARELELRLREAREVELVVRSRSGGALESFAVELRGTEGGEDLEELARELGAERAAQHVAAQAPRLGGLARAEHPQGRARVALPEQPFYLRVLASGHHLFQLGPLAPERVGATLECTLEPSPGLAGLVLRGDEPAAGVRVVLRAEVDPDEEVEADGYRLRLHPDAHDEARTDDEGRFLLTVRAAGRYVVRAEPGTGAPAELGPLELDPTLGGPPVELRLGQGGAVEGRVVLADGADPEGAIVGITRGDGAARTRRVGRDGRFRFEELLPGPWRVELRDEEVFGPTRSISTRRGGRIAPFDLAANCTVHEGETTYVDVSDVEEGAFLFSGRLMVDERPALGWTAKLGPAGVLDFDDGAWSALDTDGRFELQVRAPGRYRLTLRRLGSERQEQLLFEDVELVGGDGPWERALHMGKLRLSGLDAWDGEGAPPVVHHWKGTGQLFVLTVSVIDGEPIEVPAGRSELRAPDRSMDPESWKVVRELTIPRSGELRVELSPSDLR